MTKKKPKYKLKEWILYQGVINDTLGKVKVRGVSYVPKDYYIKHGLINPKYK